MPANPNSASLRQAAAILMAAADQIDGRVTSPDQMTTFGGRSVTVSEAWALLLEEIAARAKPHPWVDWVSGVAPGDSGDNDPVDEELLRAFKPFMDAATREGIEDSAGARFYLPTIKKRAGIGPHASGVIRDEIRRVWESNWGLDWRADSANLAAGHVPAADVVARLFAKVYG